MIDSLPIPILAYHLERSGETRWILGPRRVLGRIDDPPLMTLIDPIDQGRWQTHLDRVASEGQGEVEVRMVALDGAARWLACSHSVDEGGVILGWAWDITTRKLREIELEHQATHDPLTGALNRATFYSHLDLACQQREQPFAVMYLDLDDFKKINDTYGHLTGDECLRQVAEAIRATIRGGDAVARMGGDEFAILLPRCQPTYAIVCSDRIRQTVSALTPALRVSTGLAVWVEGDTPDDLIHRADVAMFSAKRGQRGCHMDGQTSACAEIGLLRELEAAIDKGRLLTFLQPVAQAHNRRFVGYECLARWRRNGVLLSPASFLPLAEEAGWMDRIDWQQLERACATLESGLPGQYLSVNVSGQTLSQPGFAARLRKLLADTFVDPLQLKLEISETIAIGADRFLSSDQVLQQLSLVSSNVPAPGLWLDDFGSAFAQLQQLMILVRELNQDSTNPAIQVVKLDGSFIRDLANDPTRLSICRAAIDMAHSLGLQALAEGVERDAEASALRALGCDLLQGYLLGEPLPLDEYLP